MGAAWALGGGATRDSPTSWEGQNGGRVWAAWAVFETLVGVAFMMGEKGVVVTRGNPEILSMFFSGNLRSLECEVRTARALSSAGQPGALTVTSAGRNTRSAIR